MGADTVTKPATRTTAQARRAIPPLLLHLGAAIIALVLVVALTLATDPFTNLRIATVGYYVLALAGLAVLTGMGGQISLGHGAFLFIGAYTVGLLVIHAPSLPIWADLIAAAVAGGIAGLLTGAAAARLHGPYLAGATLALAVGLPAITQRFPDFLGGSNGLSFTVNSEPAGLAVPSTRWQAWLVWLTVLIALVLLANIARGRLGRRMRSVRDDEVAASLAGIHVGRTKIVAFLISAACGGLAGGLQAFLLGTAAPGSFTPALSLSLLAALVLGGIGSLWGALWGALALVYFQAWAEDVSDALQLPTPVANNLPLALYGVILIVITFVAPHGIQGGLRRLGALAHRTRGGNR
ncbi:branched-chain amino acid ABC transporter permease [Labedaea rhizosphaerae]|uniref:Amino acid/amide ABC transporter membrane protein 2 (HAAT family) n=1 Tax=Labedaea rhizosphaerae TaxID=598644 RepID=A0A4R6SD06_LABRH|nr:branched-chain amino acid ABC transporter permease [Labedaea rhizosphaerae]TDP97812.1 amino acid/amide ABC transporter membrane protein 2 (HAAT family) [Labedaea rhizosphaerae]